MTLNSELLDQTQDQIDPAKVLDFFKRYPVTPWTITREDATGFDCEEDTDPIITKEMAGTQFQSGNKPREEPVLSYKYSPEMHWFDVDKTKDGQVVFKKLSYPRRGALYGYYLPWGSMRVTSMKLPRGRNPRLFFTTSVSGCSVFARGDPANPVVYHAGTEWTYLGNAPAFWRQCVRIAAGRDGITDLSDLTGVGKHDYMNKNDLAVTQFKNWIEGKSAKDKLTVELTSNSGFVFGIRLGGQWSLYLQQRVKCDVVVFYKTKPGLFKKATTKSKKKTVQRPISLRKFYPAGSYHVNMMDQCRLVS